MEQKKNEAKQEPTAEENLGLLDKTAQILAELNAANKKHEELLAREERLRAFNALSGKSVSEQQTPPKEETPREYAKRVMTGRL